MAPGKINDMMIDFKQELAKYNFQEVDPEFVRDYQETSRIAGACTAALRRIGKDLHQTNLQIEEILSLYQEEHEREQLLAEMRKKVAASAEEKPALVQGLIAVSDRLEDIYRFILKNENGSWLEQIRLVWNNAGIELLPLGIFRIEGEKSRFDARLHAVVGVKEEPAVADGVILEVIRCGYLYQSQCLRKAKVIVNKCNGRWFQNE